MKEEMYKSLCELIDETLSEVEELKKSNRFSASEIKIEGPGDGIGGQDPDGKLGGKAKKADEDEDEDEDKKEEVDKAEGKNRESDPNGGHHAVVKADDEDEDEDEDKKEDKDVDKAEGKNRESDPNGGHHQPAYKSAVEADDLKKSIDESNDLIKSYVEGRIAPLEDKLTDMMTLMREIADAPVASKGASYRDVTPLKKSDENEVAPLSKAQVADKLLELKKSGTNVNSTDIVSAELGSPADLAKIVDKYNLN